MIVLSNPCIRCGKERKLVKTWKELVGTSMVTYSLSTCPDPACQKIVDSQNKEKERKREENMQKIQARQQARFGHRNKPKLAK